MTEQFPDSISFLRELPRSSPPQTARSPAPRYLPWEGPRRQLSFVGARAALAHRSGRPSICPARVRANFGCRSAFNRDRLACPNLRALVCRCRAFTPVVFSRACVVKRVFAPPKESTLPRESAFSSMKSKAAPILVGAGETRQLRSFLFPGGEGPDIHDHHGPPVGRQGSGF